MAILHWVPFSKRRHCLLIGLLLCASSTPAIAPNPAFVDHSQSREKTASVTIARAGFEQFKKLEGKWRGRSTKGWEEVVNYKTIAQGTVVVANSFDAHPNETMMTMFYLDGDRLMLTHYCVARNQPRLVATSFGDDGRTITFTFLDGTNLPSRNHGHMDKLVFRFVDENHAVSRWTWYQDGKERWLEEIALERITQPPADGQ